MKAGIVARPFAAAFAAWAWCACACHAAEAIIDDGAQGRLTGVVKRTQVEDIEAGIETNVTIWVLHLDAPFTLRSDGYGDGPGPNQTTNIWRVQLALSVDQYALYASLVDRGAQVAVRGDLLLGINVHHHTPTLIDVKSIKALPTI